MTDSNTTRAHSNRAAKRMGGGGWCGEFCSERERERLMRHATAALRQHASSWRWTNGQVFLTTERLVWSPGVGIFLDFLLPKGRTQPLIIELSDIETCELGQHEFGFGYPIVVEAQGDQYRIYLYNWNRIWAGLGSARKWVDAINEAVSK